MGSRIITRPEDLPKLPDGLFWRVRRPRFGDGPFAIAVLEIRRSRWIWSSLVNGKELHQYPGIPNVRAMPSDTLAESAEKLLIWYHKQEERCQGSPQIEFGDFR
jgi:hypothetical protein